MLTGIDHVIIGVADLERATSRLGEAMGLVVAPGGAHPGWGTHNATVSFGLNYIELLAIRDGVEAAGSQLGRTLGELLVGGDGWVGFAIASDDLAADVAAMRTRGVAVGEVRGGSRRRPDGTLLRWQMADVADNIIGQRLPFLIEHGAPPAERRGWAPAGGHTLTASGIVGVTLAVPDLEAAVARFRQLLGCAPSVVEEVPALPARRATFTIGSAAQQRIELLEPTASNGGLRDFVREREEGLFLVTLAVPNLERAVAVLRERGTAVGNPTPRRRAPLLDPTQTLGARFQLVEQRPEAPR